MSEIDPALASILGAISLVIPWMLLCFICDYINVNCFICKPNIECNRVEYNQSDDDDDTNEYSNNDDTDDNDIGSDASSDNDVSDTDSNSMNERYNNIKELGAYYKYHNIDYFTLQDMLLKNNIKMAISRIDDYIVEYPNSRANIYAHIDCKNKIKKLIFTNIK